MKLVRLKNTLRVWAPAKVNLFLKVGKLRGDGYHDLETVFQEVSLFDELSFQSTVGPFHLTADSKTVPGDSSNLIIRALALLKSKLNIASGMEIHLKKKIPMGAGLGGGSSNAAAALWAGWILWKKKKTSRTYIPQQVPARLLELASRLGSDVPFFLRGGRAYAEGRGEKLTPLPPSPKTWMILVYPKVHVSTPLAYRLLDEWRHSKIQKQTGLAESFNSFEPVVFQNQPTLKKVRDKLLEAGLAHVAMSGSGSTLFGMVDSKQEGQRILSKLSSYNWDKYLVHTL